MPHHSGDTFGYALFFATIWFLWKVFKNPSSRKKSNRDSRIEEALNNIAEINEDSDQSIEVYTHRSFHLRLEQDIKNAQHSVVIFSGYITVRRIQRLEYLFKKAIFRGVKIWCILPRLQDNGTMSIEHSLHAVEILEKIGVKVEYQSLIHQKACIIDECIVWWGSLNILSYSQSHELMTRKEDEAFASRIFEALLWKIPVSSYAASQSVTNGKIKYDCPRCGSDTTLKRGRYGAFYGCVKYPDCKGTRKLEGQLAVSEVEHLLITKAKARN